MLTTSEFLALKVVIVLIKIKIIIRRGSAITFHHEARSRPASRSSVWHQHSSR
jgi:hypothetical protein